MQIRWRDAPNEIRTAVEPLIRRWEHLLPTWVHFVMVAYDQADSGSMTNRTYPEYRFAKLWVNAGWLTCTPEERSDLVRHEFLHLPIAPLFHLGHDLIDTLVQDEACRKTLHEQWRVAHEGAITDLEYALRANHERELTSAPAPDVHGDT